MISSDIAVVTNSNMAKNGGIITITYAFFRTLFPIFDTATAEDVLSELSSFRTIVFSGFGSDFVPLVRNLKSLGKKIVVIWHFSCASEVDKDIGEAWRALLPLLQSKDVDLFVSNKWNFENIIQKLYGINSFFLMNNIINSSRARVPKQGLGIYSGSSNYWIKNLYANLYACLMTDLPIDIIPYDDSLQKVVHSVGKDSLVSGTSERISYEAFQDRMATRQLITYVTFTESSPLTPLEALNSGVICLTGNNHHYFTDDSALCSYLVISRPDDPFTISQYIVRALDNQKEILERYRAWKTIYDEKQSSNFDQFISLLSSL